MKRIALAVTLLMSVAAPSWADGDAFVLRLQGFVAYGQGDYESALRKWKPAAEEGDAKSQVYLGIMYDEGRGVPQDDAEAVKWYRRAAEQGLDQAQTNLGVMYATGQGVPQDDKAAVRWFRKAAEQGHARAQNNLGFMYANGQGVPQNLVLAHMWFDLGAAASPPGVRRDRAVAARDFAAKSITPAQLAEAQRLAREWKPKKE